MCWKVYSEAVRVDSLFLPLFLFAFLQIARVLQDGRRAQYDGAGILTGLTVGANYNGAILAPWLVLAHVLNRGRAAGERPPVSALLRAVGLAAVALVASSPFLLLDARRAGKYLAFLAGLSIADHPGMEGRGFFFYASDLVAANPYLAAAIALTAVAIVLIGTRTERFVLSLPVVYVVLFSLMRTKFDRFIIPAVALLVIAASGLPAIVARRWHAAPRWRAVASVLTALLLAVSVAAWAPRAIPIPRNEMLARSDGLLLEWIEQHVPPRSRILVEPGLLPLVDVFNSPGRLAEELRRSLVRIRPNLDDEFIVATYVGEQSNYDFATIVQRADYAIVSPRNVEYIRSRCDAFAEVCAFYRELGKQGRKVYRVPDGFELGLIYDLRPQ